MFLRELSPVTKNWLIIIGLSVLAYLVWAMSSIVAPFLISVVIAYILNPLVRGLERRRLPRPWAVLALFAAGMILSIVVILPVTVNILSQADDLIARLAAMDVRQISLQYREMGQALLDRLAGVPWLKSWAEDFLVAGRLNDMAAEGLVTVKNTALTVFRRVFGFVLSAFSGVLGLLILPLLTFYILVDLDLLYEKAIMLVPPMHKESTCRVLREIDLNLSALLRGQMILCALFGTLMGIGLWLAGLSFALFLGPLAGIANLVPYLGGLVTIFLSVLVAISQHGFSHALVVTLIKVGVVLSVIQALDGLVLQPRIIGETAGLHPLAVMLALVIGGSVFGFAGMILAVPVTCILKVLSRELYHELYDPA
jgi:predicted PurR-regulated permease PerM